MLRHACCVCSKPAVLDPPRSCFRSHAQVDKVYPGTTLTKDWKQLQPLPCPTGFAKASKKQLNQYIKRFLYDYITNQKVGLPVVRAPCLACS